MRSFITWGIAASFLFASHIAFGQSSKGAGVVNGETITQEQVDKAAAADLQRLDQERAQFELTQQRQKNAALQNALDEIVEQKVLEAEAKKRGITVDALVQAEVESHVSAPSDAAIEKFYADNKARINGTLEQVRDQIRNYLRDQERTKVAQDFVGKLKKDYNAKSYIEPARSTVATEGHPAKGSASAPVTIVEFSDFECPYCGGLYPTLKEIEKNYPQGVRIVYRQFPLTNLH